MSIKINFDIQKYYDNGTFDKSEVNKIKEELEAENIPYNTEELIVTFIYLCNGDLNDAKSVLIKSYLCKKNIPEIFSNRSHQDDLIKKQWKTM